ncbi:MAG: arginase family protein, partial [Pseudomonadota bacterium]
ALALASKVAAEGICGMELVEVSPPYDTSDITALMGTRVIVDVLGALVSNGTLGKHRQLIDKPVSLPAGDYAEATHGKRWTTRAKLKGESDGA